MLCRAALEEVLNSVDPRLRHSCLKSVSNGHEKSFGEYARRATANLALPELDFDSLASSSERLEEDWWKVAAFYSLRLSLAPVVETALLLDRCLFLLENGHECALTPVFDPRASPRNQVLVAVKNDDLFASSAQSQ